jgi:polyisoprenoid-binding protein YceI
MNSKTIVSFAAAGMFISYAALKPSPTNINDYTMEGTPVTLIAEPASWSLDAKHSNIAFNVNYMAIAEVSGKFTSVKGEMTTEKDDFSDAKVNFTIDAKSVDTDDAGRDKHLNSDDFFNTEVYPEIKFTSTSFKSLGDNKYELKGDMTIRDVTKSISFEVKHGGNVTDARGAVRAGFKARAVIDRLAYGIKWANKTPDGGLVVDKDVEIVLNIQMRKAAK